MGFKDWLKEGREWPPQPKSPLMDSSADEAPGAMYTLTFEEDDRLESVSFLPNRIIHIVVDDSVEVSKGDVMRVTVGAYSVHMMVMNANNRMVEDEPRGKSIVGTRLRGH